MRFGRCLWQTAEDKRIHLLCLVSEEGDTEQQQRGPLMFQPELDHTMRKAAAAQEGIEALLEELEAAGALTKDSAEAIRRRTKESWQSRWREFDEVNDLDQFLEPSDRPTPDARS